MVKMLYLHIGSGKAGSTTIQHYLHNNKARLQDNDIFLPESTCPPHNINIAAFAVADSCDAGEKLHPILNRIGVENVDEAMSFRNKFSKDFQDEINASDKARVVISSEFCFSLKQDEVENLYALFSPVAETIKIIVYLRRQDDFWCSRYVQNVKSGKNTDLFELPDKSDAERILDYYSILCRWASTLGKSNIIVRPFVKSQLTGFNPALDILSVIGINDFDQFIAPKYMNKRLDADTLEYVRRMNALLPTLAGDYRRSSQRLRVAAQDVSDGVGFDISNVQKRLIMEMFESSNTKVSQNFLSDNDGTLFNDIAGTEELSQAQDIDFDTALNISAKLWLWVDDYIARLEGNNRKLKSKLDSNERK